MEGLRHVHQRRGVANRPDVDLAARQEGHGAVEIDGEPALDLVEDDALDLLIVFEGFFELDPALLAPRLVARDDGFAERVFDALEIDLDLVADDRRRVAAKAGEFLERHASFGLEADVDDGHVFFNRDDAALDDGTFESVGAAVAFIEQSGEIVARRRALCVCGCHCFSWGAPSKERRRRGWR